MVDIIPLTDGVITLRPTQLEDVEAIHAALQESAREVPLWLPETEGMRPDDVREFIAAGHKMWQESSAFHFGIFDAETDAYLGGCGLTQINLRHRLCNAYYWVRTAATGHGVASRATRLMARFAFEKLKMQRVEIVVEVENVPSLRAAEKAGATREGLLRNRLNNRGEPRDALIFSLIPQDLSPPSHEDTKF
jgi:ribosomal-protein-serine acetyltransferase